MTVPGTRPAQPDPFDGTDDPMTGPHSHNPLALDDAVEPPDPAAAIHRELASKSVPRRIVEGLVSLTVVVGTLKPHDRHMP